jgi:SusD/RagB-like outer membrane lipoprotein
MTHRPTFRRAAGALLVALSASLAASLAACGERITDINTNPTRPARALPQHLFSSGTSDVVNRARGGGFDLNFTSLWAQHAALDRFTEQDRYLLRPEDIDGYWSGFYAGGLQDFETIVAQVDKAASPNFVAPALVMKSWTYGLMTDLWGDIPYSEANGGVDMLTPKYDAQKDIYAGIDADLKAAAAMVTTTGATFGTADLIYGGDMAKWRRFANSLRLRYALRLSKVDPEAARARLTEALAGELITTNADDALMKWPGDGTNDNPIYNAFRTREDQHISKTMVDVLKSLYISVDAATRDTVFDPRLAVYADPILAVTTRKVYVGMPNGLQDEDAIAVGLNNTSRIGTAYRARTTPSILMTAAEVLFARAEAAARGWAGGDAAQLYAAGVRASMQYNGVADAVTDAYLASPRVVYAAATGLQQIALQRWIALFGEGSEAYSEWRRTGVPALTAGPAAVTSPRSVARRMPYPLSEQSFNNDNLASASTAQGGALLTNRVWWDKP